MTDLLLQIGVSNLCISLVLAILAWTVQSSGKRPVLAHLLWLLVLAKLVTPPILTVPMVPFPGQSAPAATEVVDRTAMVAATGATDAAYPSTLTLETGLVLAWLFGSLGVLTWSLVRIYRFNRLLRMASAEAPQELQRLASQLARRLGLRKTPTIHTTSAHVSPMVWWIGGEVRIVIPAAMVRGMDAGQLRWILAHELAHVRRRDHFVRWLEWLACVCFWWNPVAWWARRNLRANEEICCDALVLQSLNPEPRIYANSLLSAVEFLASPALRPPAMASEINSGGFLERRFRMIISANPGPRTPRWLRGLVLSGAVALLPLGVVQAQTEDVRAATEQLKAAIEAGDLTKEQVGTLMKEFGAQLRLAIAEGQVSEREAKTIMATIEKLMAEKQRPPDRSNRNAEVRKKLEEAVKSGRITKEEARRELEKVEQAEQRRELERAKAHLTAAVQAGEITDEQAKERFEELRRAVKTKPVDQDLELEEIRARIKHAVASGEMTAEEAEQHLHAYLQNREERSRRDAELEGVKKRIKMAVESGRLTEEQAKKRLEAYLASRKKKDGE